MSRLLKIKEEEAIKYFQLFQLYQTYFDPLSEYNILRDFFDLCQIKDTRHKTIQKLI